MDPESAESLPIGLARVDDDDRILGANQPFCEWANRSETELIGRQLSEVVQYSAEDLFPSQNDPGPWMMEHTTKRGRAALVVRCERESDTLVTLVDATERFAALMDLRRSYALADRTRTRLELVIDAAIAFGDVDDEDRLAEILVVAASRAYGAELAVVYLIDEHGEFRQAAGEQPFGPWVGSTFVASFTDDVSEVVTIDSPDAAQPRWPTVAQAMREVGVEAILAAPLAHPGHPHYGVLACFFLHPRGFDQEAVPLADALTSQAAQTVATLRLQRRLAYAATHDETTGLPNRRLFEEQLSAVAQAPAGQLAVIFLDLDGFKTVNDRLGHAAGDAVLHEVARRLQSAVRDGDVVARYGGDEFVVVCSVTDDSAADEIAERLRASLEAPIELVSGMLTLAASVGVALASTFGDRFSTDQLIRAADQAMYGAKTRGGNRVIRAG